MFLKFILLFLKIFPKITYHHFFKMKNETLILQGIKMQLMELENYRITFTIIPKTY